MGDTMTLLLALLSLLALAGAVGLAVMLVTSSGRAIATREFGPYALPAGATVATVSMLGSLYMSEIAGFVPCRLCWVQRGFMYPLAVFLIVASVRRWKAAALLGLPVAFVGAGIALYHYAEQQSWIGGSEGFCNAASPCTDIWVEHLGFISIPFMSLMGFLFVGTAMWLQLATKRAEKSDADERSV